MDSLFDEVSKAAAQSKSDNFRDGEGILMIEEVKSFSGDSGRVFVVQGKVVESKSKGDLTLSPDQKQVVGPAVVQPNAAGSTVGWPQLVDKFKSAKGNVKAFMLALFDKKEDEISPADFAKTGEELVSKENPARGMLIGYSTYRQVTKTGPNAGKINTYVRFSHVKQTGEEIAKRRAQLG